MISASRTPSVDLSHFPGCTKSRDFQNQLKKHQERAQPYKVLSLVERKLGESTSSQNPLGSNNQSFGDLLAHAWGNRFDDDFPGDIVSRPAVMSHKNPRLALRAIDDQVPRGSGADDCGNSIRHWVYVQYCASDIHHSTVRRVLRSADNAHRPHLVQVRSYGLQADTLERAGRQPVTESHLGRLALASRNLSFGCLKSNFRRPKMGGCTTGTVNTDQGNQLGLVFVALDGPSSVTSICLACLGLVFSQKIGSGKVSVIALGLDVGVAAHVSSVVVAHGYDITQSTCQYKIYLFRNETSNYRPSSRTKVSEIFTHINKKHHNSPKKNNLKHIVGKPYSVGKFYISAVPA